MENKITRKLNDNKGASIILALFVLIVAIVISAVVIYATNSSSGRIRSVAKTDQRYYTVTSCANLLKDKITEEPIVFVRTKSGVKGSSSQTYTLKYEGSDDEVKLGSSILSDIAIRYVLQNNVSNNKTMYEASNFDFEYASGSEETVTVSAEGLIDVKIKIDLDENGDLTMTFEDGDTGNDHYKIRYTFSSDIHETIDTKETTDVSGSAPIKMETETKTTKVYWVLRKVEKI